MASVRRGSMFECSVGLPLVDVALVLAAGVVVLPLAGLRLLGGGGGDAEGVVLMPESLDETDTNERSK